MSKRRGTRQANGQGGAGVFWDGGPTIPKRSPPKGPVTVKESALKPGLWGQYFDGVKGFARADNVSTVRRAAKHWFAVQMNITLERSKRTSR